MTDSSGKDEPDGESESRIRSVIVSLLQRLNLVPTTGYDIDEGVDESRDYGPAESTPIPIKVSRVYSYTYKSKQSLLLYLLK